MKVKVIYYNYQSHIHRITFLNIHTYENIFRIRNKQITLGTLFGSVFWLGEGEEGVGDYGVGLIRYAPRRNGAGHYFAWGGCALLTATFIRQILLTTSQ